MDGGKAVGRPNMGLTRVLIGIPEEMLAEIDAICGDDTRSAWLREAVAQRLAQPSEAAPTGDAYPQDALVRMLLADNKRMRSAGLKLAGAAVRVVDEYDGVHRLSLAVAEWMTAIADEGNRPVA